MSKITIKQKEVLVNYMEDNYRFLYGKFANNQGKKFKDDKWNELNILLNDAGPPKKNVEKWKRVNSMCVFCYAYILNFFFQFLLVVGRFENGCEE